MSIESILSASLVILFTTAGQIFLKRGADLSVDKFFFNTSVLFGYLFFLVDVDFSYYLMKLVPMKYITVIMCLNSVAVSIATGLFLSEDIKHDRVVGTVAAAGVDDLFIL